MSGFMNPPSPKKQSRFMQELGPRKTVQPKRAEAYLDDLDEQTTEQLLSIGRYVKMAMRWQTKPISYRDLIGSMYPLLGHYKSAILAELLQEADPIDVPSTASVVTTERRTQAHDGVHAQYASLIPQQPSESRTQPVEPQAELSLEGTAPQATPQAPQRIGAADEFIQRLVMSESSGDPNAEITIKDGRRFVGSLQFGEARLQDYKAATGKQFTQDEFQADEALQEKVALWHVTDLNQAIDALGDAAKGYNRDGLRSVAHLGGKGGMKRFVQSGGKYNPADELGTSLKDYYDKFSSNT